MSKLTRLKQKGDITDTEKIQIIIKTYFKNLYLTKIEKYKKWKISSMHAMYQFKSRSGNQFKQNCNPL